MLKDGEAQIYEKDFQLRRQKLIKFRPSGITGLKNVRLLESYAIIDEESKILDIGCDSYAMVNYLIKSVRILDDDGSFIFIATKLK